VLAKVDVQHQIELKLVKGTTAREAVLKASASGLDLGDIGSAETVPIGVFGEQVDDDYVLLNDDRVEIYRSLKQSPMELRRLRAAAQQKNQS